MLSIILFILGFVCLWKGGECIVDGASALARRFHIPDIIIGLTLVSIGTSLPELVVNVIASVDNEADIVFGNIVGSNISNTLLILGLTGLIFPFRKQLFLLKKELFIYAFMVFLMGLFIFFPNSSLLINRLEGGLLLTLFFISIWLFYQQMSNSNDENYESKSLIKALFLFIFGCVLLPLGGHWVVSSAISIATEFDIQKSIISLFAIALGTSLPELVTSIVAAKKQNSSLALGNIIGSNIFNITLILSISTLISPIQLGPSFLFDYFILLGSSGLFLLFMFCSQRYMLIRTYCGLLFVSYLTYIVFLFFRST